MNIDRTFEHQYGFQILDMLKVGYEVYYYPDASTIGGKDGLIVQVDPVNGQSWIGVFAFGDFGRSGLSGGYTMPNADRLCIISKGRGYLVTVKNPTDWETVRSIPVKDVLVSKTHNLIVFADNTKLTAYNKDGIKWITKRLTWDDLRVVEVSDNCIKGTYYDIRSDADEFFEVDIASGHSKGGVE